MLHEQLLNKQTPIGIIGLGYVGLPLASLFATKYKVVGFDIDAQRVKELNEGYDRTGEVVNKNLLCSESISFTTSLAELNSAKLIIVTVPTPVDSHNTPDLSPLRKASKSVAQIISKGAVVVFESTVYPGVTEDICTKIIEDESGLILNKDFYVGYSPERINPGDKERTLDSILKIVSGSTEAICQELAEIYGSVVTAGIHQAPNIKTAEAAKVIENTQRDVNIALINELALVFDEIGIDTQDVLEAAGTKWNFLKFSPGLVGGHCIGVDPYYLSHLADKLGLHTSLIDAGRRINDHMSKFIAHKTMQLIMKFNNKKAGPYKVLVLGAAFKEDVPDLRNSKVIQLVEELKKFNLEVMIFDPVVNIDELKKATDANQLEWNDIPCCDAVILAVPHKKIVEKYDLPSLLEKCPDSRILIDIKSYYETREATKLSANHWRL